MFGLYQPHSQIRKYIAVFGTIFNNIVIARTSPGDPDRPTPEAQTQSVPALFRIPIAFGPREKMLARVTADPELDRGYSVLLPRMGFELVSMTYDADRKLTSATPIIFPRPVADWANNVVTNGAFEANTTGWTVSNSTFVTANTANPQQGNNHIRITSNNSIGQSISQNVPTAPGKIYSLTFFVSTSGTNTLSYLKVNAANNTIINRPSPISSQAYQHVTSTFTASSNSTNIKFEGRNNSGAIDIDDIKVRLVKSAYYSHANMPVPYNLNFELSIMANRYEDLAKIVEQILPNFKPALTVQLKMIDELPDCSFDTLIVLNMPIQIDDSYDSDIKERRVLVWTLRFTVKGLLFGHIQQAKVIKIATTNMFANTNANPSIDTPSVRITTKPGLTANGAPTSNTADSINHLLIEDYDNWGFIIDITDTIP